MKTKEVFLKIGTELKTRLWHSFETTFAGFALEAAIIGLQTVAGVDVPDWVHGIASVASAMLISYKQKNGINFPEGK